MLLAHISATSQLGRALQGAGVFTQRHHPDWFDDADRALEWAERQLLDQSRASRRAIASSRSASSRCSRACRPPSSNS